MQAAKAQAVQSLKHWQVLEHAQLTGTHTHTHTKRALFTKRGNITNTLFGLTRAENTLAYKNRHIINCGARISHTNTPSVEFPEKTLIRHAATAVEINTVLSLSTNICSSFFNFKLVNGLWSSDRSFRYQHETSSSANIFTIQHLCIWCRNFVKADVSVTREQYRLVFLKQNNLFW